MIEPVQGHGGCLPAGRRFLEGLRERADAHGELLVFDEIQTGFGRPGDWFAGGTYGVEPDVMTMAKAIGAGFPLSAIGARSEVMATMGPGEHGSTFGATRSPARRRSLASTRWRRRASLHTPACSAPGACNGSHA